MPPPDPGQRSAAQRAPPPRCCPPGVFPPRPGLPSPRGGRTSSQPRGRRPWSLGPLCNCSSGCCAPCALLPTTVLTWWGEGGAAVCLGKLRGAPGTALGDRRHRRSSRRIWRRRAAGCWRYVAGHLIWALRVITGAQGCRTGLRPPGQFPPRVSTSSDGVQTGAAHTTAAERALLCGRTGLWQQSANQNTRTSDSRRPSCRAAWWMARS